MRVIDQLLTILAPYECLGCTSEGNLLCEACTQQLTVVPECCHYCRRPSTGSLTCSGCRLTGRLYRVQSGTAYSGIAKELVWKMKFSGAQTASRRMAERLLPLLNGGSKPLVIPVPTATNRVRGRGYDQAKLLAREISRQGRLSYLDCLVRNGRTHQVGASRQQRLSQLKSAFRVSNLEKFHNADVLLVDDVLTTGATLEAAATILAIHGAARISAIVFAQA